MSFYFDHASPEERDYYNKMLVMMASLSNLFSESPKPYLVSRFTENAFCKCLGAENLSRGDVTADAAKDDIGIGIKTWIGTDLQKIAEFNSLRPTYENDNEEDLIHKIAKYRNDRINFTMRTYRLDTMIYHCTIREEGKINIIECPLELIDISKIRDIEKKKNVINFNDQKNRYSFNVSKSTLYKRFDEVETIQVLPVEIITDPYSYLADLMHIQVPNIKQKGGILVDTAILPLYSTLRSSGEKYVPPSNNLNMRFAKGRPRDPYEIGIPIPADFRRQHPDFFLGINYPFNLRLPNGKVLSAKQCQQDGKALMSNPNKALGHWLIDDVLKIAPDIPITYEMLEQYGIDAVRIEKYKNTTTNEFEYSMNFARTGSYEYYMATGSADITIIDTA